MSKQHSSEAFDATEEGALLSFLTTHSDKPTVIQLSSPNCTRCLPFSQFIQKEIARRDFYWVTINVFENRELVETFEVTSVPAFVIVNSGHVGEVTKESSLAHGQNASIDTLASALDTHCPCEVKLDEEF